MDEDKSLVPPLSPFLQIFYSFMTTSWYSLISTVMTLFKPYFSNTFRGSMHWIVEQLGFAIIPLFLKAVSGFTWYYQRNSTFHSPCRWIITTSTPFLLLLSKFLAYISPRENRAAFIYLSKLFSKFFHYIFFIFKYHFISHFFWGKDKVLLYQVLSSNTFKNVIPTNPVAPTIHILFSLFPPKVQILQQLILQLCLLQFLSTMFILIRSSYLIELTPLL